MGAQQSFPAPLVQRAPGASADPPQQQSRRVRPPKKGAAQADTPLGAPSHQRPGSEGDVGSTPQRSRRGSATARSVPVTAAANSPAPASPEQEIEVSSHSSSSSGTSGISTGTVTVAPAPAEPSLTGVSVAVEPVIITDPHPAPAPASAAPASATADAKAPSPMSSLSSLLSVPLFLRLSLSDRAAVRQLRILLGLEPGHFRPPSVPYHRPGAGPSGPEEVFVPVPSTASAAAAAGASAAAAAAASDADSPLPLTASQMLALQLLLRLLPPAAAAAAAEAAAAAGAHANAVTVGDAMSLLEMEGLARPPVHTSAAVAAAEADAAPVHAPTPASAVCKVWGTAPASALRGGGVIAAVEGPAPADPAAATASLVAAAGVAARAEVASEAAEAKAKAAAAAAGNGNGSKAGARARARSHEDAAAVGADANGARLDLWSIVQRLSLNAGTFLSPFAASAAADRDEGSDGEESASEGEGRAFSSSSSSAADDTEAETEAEELEGAPHPSVSAALAGATPTVVALVSGLGARGQKQVNPPTLTSLLFPALSVSNLSRVAAASTTSSSANHPLCLRFRLGSAPIRLATSLAPAPNSALPPGPAAAAAAAAATVAAGAAYGGAPLPLLAALALVLDPRLSKWLPKIVPKKATEEAFWGNYFSHLAAVLEGICAGVEVVPAPIVRRRGAEKAGEVPSLCLVAAAAAPVRSRAAAGAGTGTGTDAGAGPAPPGGPPLTTSGSANASAGPGSGAGAGAGGLEQGLGPQRTASSPSSSSSSSSSSAAAAASATPPLWLGRHGLCAEVLSAPLPYSPHPSVAAAAAKGRAPAALAQAAAGTGGESALREGGWLPPPPTGRGRAAAGTAPGSADSGSATDSASAAGAGLEGGRKPLPPRPAHAHAHAHAQAQAQSKTLVQGQAQQEIGQGQAQEAPVPASADAPAQASVAAAATGEVVPSGEPVSPSELGIWAPTVAPAVVSAAAAAGGPSSAATVAMAVAALLAPYSHSPSPNLLGAGPTASGSVVLVPRSALLQEGMLSCPFESVCTPLGQGQQGPSSPIRWGVIGAGAGADALLIPALNKPPPLYYGPPTGPLAPLLPRTMPIWADPAGPSRSHSAEAGGTASTVVAISSGSPAAAAVGTSEPPRAVSVARTHGIPSCFLHPAALVSSPTVDAVALAVPPGAAQHLLTLVAAAGKPCLLLGPAAGRGGVEAAAVAAATRVASGSGSSGGGSSGARLLAAPSLPRSQERLQAAAAAVRALGGAISVRYSLVVGEEWAGSRALRMGILSDDDGDGDDNDDGSTTTATDSHSSSENPEHAVAPSPEARTREWVQERLASSVAAVPRRRARAIAAAAAAASAAPHEPTSSHPAGHAPHWWADPLLAGGGALEFFGTAALDAVAAVVGPVAEAARSGSGSGSAHAGAAALERFGGDAVCARPWKPATAAPLIPASDTNGDEEKGAGTSSSSSSSSLNDGEKTSSSALPAAPVPTTPPGAPTAATITFRLPATASSPGAGGLGVVSITIVPHATEAEQEPYDELIVNCVHGTVSLPLFTAPIALARGRAALKQWFNHHAAAAAAAAAAAQSAEAGADEWAASVAAASAAGTALATSSEQGAPLLPELLATNAAPRVKKGHGANSDVHVLATPETSLFPILVNESASFIASLAALAGAPANPTAAARAAAAAAAAVAAGGTSADCVTKSVPGVSRRLAVLASSPAAVAAALVLTAAATVGARGGTGVGDLLSLPRCPLMLAAATATRAMTLGLSVLVGGPIAGAGEIVGAQRAIDAVLKGFYRSRADRFWLRPGTWQQP